MKVIRVFRSPIDGRRGRVRLGAVEWPCALGRSGLVSRKREGDGGTPVGRMKVLAVRFRRDRVPRPRTGATVSRIGPLDGWCDDPSSRSYNRPIRLPTRLGHENLWRTDDVYDLVVDLGWNRGPIAKGSGSAIFLHVTRPGFRPTEGCVALARGTVTKLLTRVGRGTIVETVDPGRASGRPVKHRGR